MCDSLLTKQSKCYLLIVHKDKPINRLYTIYDIDIQSIFSLSICFFSNPSVRKHMLSTKTIDLEYRPDIDGIRAIAVLAVIFFHYEIPGFSGGFVGVDIFFVISGYLISRIIYAEILSHRFTLVGFYERRIRRIWPILLFVTVLSSVVALFLFDSDELNKFYASIAALQYFSTNFHFWGQAGYFDAPSIQKPLLHTWSLAIEEQYYLIFPALFLFLFRRTSQKIWIRILLIITIASLASNLTISYIWKDLAFYWPITRIWELLLGVLIAFHQEKLRKLVNSKLLLDLIGIFSLGLILMAIGLYTRETRYPGVAVLLPCFAAGFILLAGSERGSITNTFLSQKVLVGLGLISYSLYLWHWPIWVFVSSLVLETPSLTQRAMLILVVIFISVITWRYIEKPCRKRNNFISRRAILLTFLLVSGVLFLLSLIHI